MIIPEWKTLLSPLLNVWKTRKRVPVSKDQFVPSGRCVTVEMANRHRTKGGDGMVVEGKFARCQHLVIGSLCFLMQCNNVIKTLPLEHCAHVTQ